MYDEEDDIPRYRKKPDKKKIYTIESRRNPEAKPNRPYSQNWFWNMLSEDWTVLSKYKTKKGRDDAWKNLIKKATSKSDFMSCYYTMREFRNGIP